MPVGIDLVHRPARMSPERSMDHQAVLDSGVKLVEEEHAPQCRRARRSLRDTGLPGLAIVGLRREWNVDFGDPGGFLPHCPRSLSSPSRMRSRPKRNSVS